MNRKTKSLLIEAENNAIRNHYFKAKFNYLQKNNKWRLCCDNGKINYHIISICCKLSEKEYKNPFEWVKKIIHWELSQRLQFNHADKCCTHKPESVQENETPKILLDFKIQTNHPIPTKSQYLELINKKRTCYQVDFAVSMDHAVEIKESVIIVKYKDLA